MSSTTPQSSASASEPTFSATPLPPSPPPGQSPFPGDIKWNFNKFLVGKDGKILKRFESKVTPDSEELTKAVEAALAAK